MKAGSAFRLLSMVLCLGCVNLDRPKEVAECSSTSTCSNQALVDGASARDNVPEAGNFEDGKVDLVSTGSDTASAGGSIDASQVTGSGGLAGSGGVIALDGSAGVGGVSGSGGIKASDGSAGSGGTAGSGGATALDAPIHIDTATGPDGASSKGGVTGSGGGVSSGGTAATGGNTGSGGQTSPDGPLGSGGMGGATNPNCGTVPSKLSQTFSFATNLGTLSIGTSSNSGSKLTHVTTGPTANPTLCTSGCAALSLTYASGAAAYKAFALAVENFGAATDLVGSTVTFSLAIDNPGATPVPIQVQAYAQGDESSSYAWSQPATVKGTNLLTYAAETGFKDLALQVTNTTSATGEYCSAVTGALGIQLQNSADITDSNAGTVTIYIAKITVAPPS